MEEELEIIEFKYIAPAKCPNCGDTRRRKSNPQRFECGYSLDGLCWCYGSRKRKEPELTGDVSSNSMPTFIYCLDTEPSI